MTHSRCTSSSNDGWYGGCYSEMKHRDLCNKFNQAWSQPRWSWDPSARDGWATELVCSSRGVQEETYQTSDIGTCFTKYYERCARNWRLWRSDRRLHHYLMQCVSQLYWKFDTLSLFIYIMDSCLYIATSTYNTWSSEWNRGTWHKKQCHLKFQRINTLW